MASAEVSRMLAVQNGFAFGLAFPVVFNVFMQIMNTTVDRALFPSYADLVHPSTHFLLVILDQLASALGAFQHG